MMDGWKGSNRNRNDNAQQCALHSRSPTQTIHLWKRLFLTIFFVQCCCLALIRAWDMLHFVCLSSVVTVLLGVWFQVFSYSSLSFFSLLLLDRSQSSEGSNIYQHSKNANNRTRQMHRRTSNKNLLLCHFGTWKEINARMSTEWSKFIPTQTPHLVCHGTTSATSTTNWATFAHEIHNTDRSNQL